jgi:predicted NUDIX family NTP pyrophosphohydrolase
MEKSVSAGILAYKIEYGKIKFLLVHPGGLFWKNKEEYSWQLPKGGVENDETHIETAIREFEEETGIKVTHKSRLLDLGMISTFKKDIYIFAHEAEQNDEFICSNTCEIEFPPKSGKMISIPENDKGKWFTFEECKKFMNKNQFTFIIRFLNAKG